MTVLCDLKALRVHSRPTPAPRVCTLYVAPSKSKVSVPEGVDGASVQAGNCAKSHERCVNKA